MHPSIWSVRSARRDLLDQSPQPRQSPGGKALLAHFPEEKVNRVIQNGLGKKTDDTITSGKQLKEAIENIRDRGYAFNREEQIEGVNAVGAPVKDERGEVVGAFSVSGPSNRLSGDRLTDELPRILLGVTNEYELRVSLS